jgi:transcriptional adapter 2-alpha
MGKEPEKHSKFHKYQAFNGMHFPLFIHSWTAEEELLLIEGLTLYGFGNWADIADYVGKDKKEEKNSSLKFE